jgi:hypothetical protein
MSRIRHKMERLTAAPIWKFSLSAQSVAGTRGNAPDQALSWRREQFMSLMILPVDASLSARQAPRRFQR